ncbi:hypothetical protein PPERSA_08662 [Pseudocohnilembus persalinus]|uniref:Uncharacterized protein n=1 Tax=Pseudocohnilembus persalinus TaxID=266149 RepID=A0A0V0R860_PSEPJ|nr:hypothetical protein PPERSA_08662 [Pseudocohnilembus persalinus]|eukprot:KRX10667.1 hypothetical protein PPERSA_08662 [Pseudocohnilembus persalinus]
MQQFYIIQYIFYRKSNKPYQNELFKEIRYFNDGSGRDTYVQSPNSKNKVNFYKNLRSYPQSNSLNRFERNRNNDNIYFISLYDKQNENIMKKLVQFQKQKQQYQEQQEKCKRLTGSKTRFFISKNKTNYEKSQESLKSNQNSQNNWSALGEQKIQNQNISQIQNFQRNKEVYKNKKFWERNQNQEQKTNDIKNTSVSQFNKKIFGDNSELKHSQSVKFSEQSPYFTNKYEQFNKSMQEQQFKQQQQIQKVQQNKFKQQQKFQKIDPIQISSNNYQLKKINSFENQKEVKGKSFNQNSQVYQSSFFSKGRQFRKLENKYSDESV